MVVATSMQKIRNVALSVQKLGWGGGNFYPPPIRLAYIKKPIPNRVNNKRKAFKMTVLMTTIFIVLVYPRDIFHMIYMMDYLVPTPAIRYINIIFKIMASSNSIANVFIYSRMHNRFRRCVKTFFIRSNKKTPKSSVCTLKEELNSSL